MAIIKRKQKKKLRLSKKARLIIVAIVGLVVVLGVTGWYLWSNYQTSSDKDASKEEKFLTKADELDHYKTSGQQDKAQALLDTSLAEAKDDHERYKIYIQKAGVALGSENYGDAERFAKKAVELKPDSTAAYVVLANLFEKMGNKQEAISYYRQALEVLDPDSPQYINSKTGFEINIARLSE